MINQIIAGKELTPRAAHLLYGKELVNLLSEFIKDELRTSKVRENDKKDILQAVERIRIDVDSWLLKALINDYDIYTDEFTFISPNQN